MTGELDLVRRLADADPEVRRLATLELGSAEAMVGTRLLVAALGDEDWRVRKEAAKVAVTLEARGAVLAALYAALEDRENVGLRNAAVEALAEIGSDAVALAIGALARMDADARKLVVDLLAQVPDPGGVTALVRTLADPDTNVRLAAAEGLGRAARSGADARSRAIEALVPMMTDRDLGTRLASIEALARLEADVPFESIEPHVDDPVTRRAAFGLLAHTSSRRAWLALVLGLTEPTPDARSASAALARQVERHLDDAEPLDIASRTLSANPVTRERLRVLACAGDREVRSSALLLLGLVKNREDVALLVEALSDPEVSDRAELALQLFGEEVAAPLLTASLSAPPAARGASLSIVPMLDAAPTPDTVSALRAALDDDSVEVVNAALRSLAAVGQEADLPVIARLLAHDAARVAQGARTALRTLAERFPEEARAFVEARRASGDLLAITIVLEVLGKGGGGTDEDRRIVLRAATHGDAVVRRAALEALASLGGEGARDAVKFALADEEDDVVLAAVRALGRLRDVEALVDLARETRSPALVAAAIRALAEADPERAILAATPLLREPDGEIASAAIETLSVVSPDTRGSLELRANALSVALEHPDPQVVKLALAALPQGDDPVALAGLATGLLHDTPDVRKLAADLLGQVGAPGSRHLLLARLEREKDQVVKDAIFAALRRQDGTR